MKAFLILLLLGVASARKGFPKPPPAKLQQQLPHQLQLDLPMDLVATQEATLEAMLEAPLEAIAPQMRWLMPVNVELLPK